MLPKSKSYLLVGFLIAFSFEAHGQPLTTTCNPNVGRASSRISCLRKMVDLLNQQMIGLKSELSQYAKTADLSAYAKSSDLDQQVTALKSELSQYAKAADLSTYAKSTDVDQLLTALKFELTQYAKAADLSAYAKSSDLDQQLTALKSELGQYVKAADLSAYAKSLDLDRQVAALKAELSQYLKADGLSDDAAHRITRTAAFFVRCGNGGLSDQINIAAMPVVEKRSVASPIDKLPLSYATTLRGISMFSSELEIPLPESSLDNRPTLSECMPGEGSWLR